MKNAASWIRNYVVKVKIWEKDSEVTYFGKSIKKKEGEWKRTFEIIQDHGGIYSYNIDHVPAYETIMMGVHEGTRRKVDLSLDDEDDSDETDAGDKGLGGAELIIEAEDDLVDQSQADVQAGKEGDDTQENEAPEAEDNEDTQSDIQNGVVVAEAVKVTIVDAGPQE